MSDFLDKLAQENSHLASEEIDESQVHLATTFETSEIGMKKKAYQSHSFDRIDQFVDMHQSEAAPEYWLMKEGKIIRNPEEAPNE